MIEQEHPAQEADLQDQSVADLVRQLTELVPQLVRAELALAKAELTDKGKRAGLAAGLLGGGGALAFYGLGALIAAVALGLAEMLPGWLAALVVAVVLLLVAGLLALVARSQVRRAVPPVPEQAVQSARLDVEAVRESARR
jgi:MFS family permease